MNLLIRHYESTDLNELLMVWEKSSELAHSFLSADFFKKERENISKIYIPAADTWIAEVNNNVVGFIALIDNEVGGLFVDPEYQRLGIGFALMNKAHNLHDILEVEVFKDNSPGLNFYLRYGFRQISEYTHNETGKTMYRLRFDTSSS